MKRILSLTLITLFTVNTLTLAQKRHAPARANQPRVYCQGDKLPVDYVVVGLKPSQKCGSSSTEFVIKKPAASEIVCASSPVPPDYSVTGMTTSPACASTESNPLTNAMTIVSDAVAPALSVMTQRQRSASGGEGRSPSVSIKITSGQGQTKHRPMTTEEIVNARADEVNHQAQMNNAVREQAIMVGMTKEQVLNSWGRPSNIDKSNDSSFGPSETWYYNNPGGRASVDFKDGKVSRVHTNY